MGTVVFILALLAVPLLNLLIGALVGLSLLKDLAKRGAWLRLLLLLPLAGLWTLFAALEIAALDGGSAVKSTGQHAWTLQWVLSYAAQWHWGIWALCATATAVAILRLASPTATTNDMRMLSAANSLGKGRFSLENAFGDSSRGVMVVVDPDSKHLAFLWKTGFRIEPLSFVRSFQADWDGRINFSSGASYSENARVVLDVSDFKNPRFTAFVGSPREAEDWVSRLHLLSQAQDRSVACPG